MKKMLLLFLIYIILGLTNSQSSNIKGNSNKLLLRRNKNLMKSLDKMIIKRNLEEDDTSISEDFGSSEESSDETNSDESFEPTPNQTEPIVAGDPNADIYLIDVNNFTKPRGNHNANFNVIFYYIRRPVMKFIFFTLKIFYSRLRNLEEMDRLAICQLEDPNYANKTVNHTVKYICETNETINQDNNLIIRSDNDFKSGHNEDVNRAVSMNGLTFSKKIEKDLDNIQNKNQRIKNYYILKEAIYDDLVNNRFTLKGTMDDLDINDKNVNFTLYHNENEERNVICKIIKNQTKDYQIRCNAQNRTSANLVSAYGITDQENVITLNMKEGFDNITTGNILKNRIYQKSEESGLSGGGIAGIVIACVVALVIASIIAIMLRKPKPPIQNTSSVIQSNSVDNLNEQ